MVLALALVLGCAHTTAPIKAPSPAPIGFAAVQDPLDQATPTALPPALTERLLEQLKARNLQPSVLGGAAVMGAGRSTARRLEALAPGGERLLLVEAQAAYTSQIEGRFRWSVSVRLTLSPPETTAEFTVPVFLQFQHQDADDALVDAGPIIERQLAYLLDQYLAGLQP